MEVFGESYSPSSFPDRLVLILEEKGFDQTGAQCTPAVSSKKGAGWAVFSISFCLVNCLVKWMPFSLAWQVGMEE